eukprot:CAMPEP_0172321848 /NCGR_PEP_ID=MMETSP1058-20130122/44478_1 /TAXON_ID=83371 /ORGANISM="Detonula confervacea, Strain CCMP 353" /LENGTH=61 /DNA_ID=CAMNT_0013037457 /DNA_START=803 /DNA_END=988 /DNA_ORIENTATION=-
MRKEFNSEDLQRAVCLLAEELDELFLQNEQLEQQLEPEKSRNCKAEIEKYLWAWAHGMANN